MAQGLGEFQRMTDWDRYFLNIADETASRGRTAFAGNTGP